MKSLKQVLDMKNQQIHQQEKKIIELEKLVSWSACSGGSHTDGGVQRGGPLSCL
jgi:hypothetical protein